MDMLRKMFKKDSNDKNNKNDDKTMKKEKNEQIQTESQTKSQHQEQQQQEQQQQQHQEQEQEQQQQQQQTQNATTEHDHIDRAKACRTLNNHLAHLKNKQTQRRKSESDLSSVLQGPAHELQMAQTKDHLAQLMRKREDRHSLVEQGILLDEHCIAGSIQSNAKELERHMVCDKVEHELRNRPPKEELEKAGVIKEGMDTLQGRRCSLEQEQKKLQLKRKLSDRPTPEELQKQHILEPMDYDESHINTSSAGANTELKKKTHTKKKQKN